MVISHRSETLQKAAVGAFFAAFLILGIFIFKDYGVSWDELMQLNTGRIALRYVTGQGDELFTYRDRHYGTAVEMPLVVIEKILKLSNDSRALFLMRHFSIFLIFFLGVAFFYKLCRYRFNSRMMGLAGAFFIILSPRIFANSFYNSKDIPFLSLFIISIYTLIRFLDTPTPRRTIIHALACAILIDIRIVGIIMPFFTFLFALIYKVIGKEKTQSELQAMTGPLIGYTIFSILFTIAFWPLLWRQPLHNFIAAFKEMASYDFPYTILYFGRFISGKELPWHYVPVWIAISTPIFYLIFFAIGCVACRRRKDDLLFMVWFFAPILMVILLRSVLYDDWRQMYFIYPALLLIAMSGMEFLYNFMRSRLGNKRLILVKVSFIIAVILGLAPTAIFMIKNHPYQNVYFNRLAGRDMAEIKKNFELDYWGLSYRKALEYILATDKDTKINVGIANMPGLLNTFLLSPQERDRLEFVDSLKKAKYFVSNYRWHPGNYPYKNEYYSIKIGNAKIMAVYKLP